jgi:signal transduction histidine kinase
MTTHEKCDTCPLHAVVAQLAQAASHEINNPLTVISAHLQRLRANQTLSEQQIDTMLDCVDRIGAVIMALSRVDHAELDPRWPGLSAMLDLRLSGVSSRGIPAPEHDARPLVFCGEAGCRGLAP